MKAYITCPVTESSARLDLLHSIQEVVEKNDGDSFVFEIGGTPQDIFKRDYEQLKSCDLLIADVSEVSHGVGIEIGISYCLNSNIILLLEKGKRVTKLVQGMPRTYILEYENVEDLKLNLNLLLKEIYLIK